MPCSIASAHSARSASKSMGCLRRSVSCYSEAAHAGEVMATGEMLRALALGLDGTVEAPHFERLAFKAKRIYVTLNADKKSANFYFTPEEQEMKCAMYPGAFV